MTAVQIAQATAKQNASTPKPGCTAVTTSLCTAVGRASFQSLSVSLVKTSVQKGSLLPLYLPSNGSLLSAVSLMAAGWDGSGDRPSFPSEGWDAKHEGFTPWP